MVAVEDEHFYGNVFLNVFDGAARAALASLHASADPGGEHHRPAVGQAALPHVERVRRHPGADRPRGEARTELLEARDPRVCISTLSITATATGAMWQLPGVTSVSTRNRLRAEAAMLAGLPRAPSAYDPVVHFTLAKLRQHHVLDQLVVNHLLTEAQADAAYRAPLPLRHH